MAMNNLLLAVDLGLPSDLQYSTYADLVVATLNNGKLTLGPNSTLQPAAPNLSSSTNTDDNAQYLVFMPRILRTITGVRRIYSGANEYVLLLLEALLKESVRSSHVGEACRRSFVHIIESLAGYFDTSSPPPSFGSIVNSAQVTLDYIDGVHRAVSIAAALVLSGFSHPTSLLPVIRRRLQEGVKASDSWSAEVAAMTCLSFVESLQGTLQSEEAQFATTDEYGDTPRPVGLAAWRTVRKKDSTPRMLSSSRGASPRLEAPAGGTVTREGSPSGSGAFFSSGSSSSATVPFPEKLPAAATVPSSVIMSCAILSSTLIAVQPALSLGQWCLSALSTMPLTVTACALSQLMLKYPKAFRVSVANGEKNVRFCDAVVIRCSKIVTSLFERRVQHGVSGNFANGTQGVRDEIDDAILSVDVMPCFLVLCLTGITCMKGLLLSPDAQIALGKLVVYMSRLYVSHYAFVEEECARMKAGVSKRGNRYIPNDVVEQCIRAAFRAADIVLHDYEAGPPEFLRRILIETAPPNSTLLNKVQECGALERHEDLLETVIAATNPDIDSAFAAGLQGGKGAASKPTLAGWLPASGEPLVLSTLPIVADGGFTAKQKLWVVKRMLDYFRREWYLAKVGVQTAQLTSSESKEKRESFFSCFPRSAMI